MIILFDAANCTIVSSLFRTKHRDVMKDYGRCKQCGRAVKLYNVFSKTENGDEFAFQMTTVTIVVLVVCCVIVMGEATQRNNEASPIITDQRLAFVVRSNQRLDKIMNTCNTVVRRYQEDVKGLQRDINILQSKFACLDNTPCISRTCKFMANGIN